MIATINQEEFRIYQFTLRPPNYTGRLQFVKNLYIMLGAPLLLGGVLIYHVFEWHGTAFWTAFTILFILLLNLYFYLINNQYFENDLQLILTSHDLQIIKHRKILFQAEKSQLDIEVIPNNNTDMSTIQIKKEGKLVIAIKSKKLNRFLNRAEGIENEVYEVKSSKQWEVLVRQLVD